MPNYTKINPSTIRQHLIAGNKLMPLREKIPFKNWRTNTYTKQEILDYKGNLGLNLSKKNLVIDIDPRNGGDASYTKLEKDLGLKLTPTVRTPRGGFHIYLKIPEQFQNYNFRKILKEYPGIDFLTEGAYCLIEGCKTNHGVYSWYDDLMEFEETEAPISLINFIEKKVEESDLGDFEGLIGGSSAHWPEEKVLELLSKLDPSMLNDEWVRVGMGLHDWDPVRGLELWEEWSKDGDNYQKGETEKRWRSFDIGGGVTLGTLFYMSQEENYEKSEIEWESPILFDEYETPKISSNLLPSPLKEFSRDISYSTETPEEMAIMVILAVVATALQKKFEVMPKEHSGYKETVNIYTLTALPPANRKSSIVKACIAPLIEWEKEQRSAKEIEIKKQQSIFESQKRLIDLKRKNIKANEDNDSLIQSIAEEEAKLTPPEALPQLITNDVTPEGLARLMSEQNEKMSIFSDEGGIIDTMAGLYNGGRSNIDILLKGWEGGYISLRRKDTDLTMHPTLTINLTVQPVIIQNLGDQKAYSGKGLLERFLYCIPKSLLGYRTHDKSEVPQYIKNLYNRKIQSLLNISDVDVPRILVLDKEAYKEWYDFQMTTEYELREGGLLANCQGWGGKICGYALRISALFHVVSYGEERKFIDKNTIQKALELCTLLKSHAVAAFGFMNIDLDRRDAMEILKWILDNNLNSFTKAQLTKRMQNRKNMEAARLDKLLAILSQRYIISNPIKEGKKTISFKVNPAIYSKEKKEEAEEDIKEEFCEGENQNDDEFNPEFKKHLISLFDNLNEGNQEKELRSSAIFC